MLQPIILLCLQEKSDIFSAGMALNALTKYVLEQNQDIGISASTVNCIVTECNDGALNDIGRMHVMEKDVRTVIESASLEVVPEWFEWGKEGNCFSIKACGV